MKILIKTLIICLGSLCLIGCETMSRQDMGMITGGVAGGLLGSTMGGGSGKLITVAAGTIAGAMIGGAIGKNMDDHDRARMAHALENNNLGQPAYWRNAQTGATYEVVPIRNVDVDDNPYCREYRTIAYIGGKKREVYGTACRQPDGSWRMVS